MEKVFMKTNISLAFMMSLLLNASFVCAAQTSDSKKIKTEELKSDILPLEKNEKHEKPSKTDKLLEGKNKKNEKLSPEIVDITHFNKLLNNKKEKNKKLEKELKLSEKRNESLLEKYHFLQGLFNKLNEEYKSLDNLAKSATE
jgi:hypothetical protein